jgi:hypothetical protein
VTCTFYIFLLDKFYHNHIEPFFKVNL